MKRVLVKVAAALAIAVSAGSVTACGSDESGGQGDWVGVCVDRNTDQRITDDSCSQIPRENSNDSAYNAFLVYWMFYHLNQAPYVGYPVTLAGAGAGAGVRTLPPNARFASFAAPVTAGAPKTAYKPPAGATGGSAGVKPAAPKPPANPVKPPAPAPKPPAPPVRGK